MYHSPEHILLLSFRCQFVQKPRAFSTLAIGPGAHRTPTTTSRRLGPPTLFSFLLALVSAIVFPLFIKRIVVLLFRQRILVNRWER